MTGQRGTYVVNGYEPREVSRCAVDVMLGWMSG